MISREELQEVKDYTRSNGNFSGVYRNIWLGDSYGLEEDNQRLLDLLEAAEHYSREDAMKEAKVPPLDFNGDLIKAGDRVRIKRNFPSGSLLREGQEVVVYDICAWVSVMGPGDRHWVIDASSVEHVEPDTQDRIDDDTLLTATQYCEVYELEPVDSKYRGMLKCEHLLQRQRKLDKRLFGVEKRECNYEGGE